MIDIFSNQDTHSYPNVIIPQYDFVLEGLTQNIHKVKEFYRKGNKSVPNTHLLVQLILSLRTPVTLPLTRYMDSVAAEVRTLCVMHGIVTPYSYGKIHYDGTFYHRKYPEVYVLDDNNIDVTSLNETWKEINAITVLDHGYTDVNVHIPDGQYKYPSTRACIISINIVALALQYRAWCAENKIKVNDVATRTHQFVHAYALPNMLNSHLNTAILNRLVNNYTGIRSVPVYNNSSFVLPNYEDKLDVCLTKLNDHYRRSQLTAQQLLANIALLNTNGLSFLRLIDVAYTRQIYWALIVSRLNILNYIFNVSQDTSCQRNGYLFQQVRRTIKQLKNDACLDNLPGVTRNLVLRLHDGIEGIQ